LNDDAAMELADMVRVMNCYYSNLIEGHNTRPKNIENALAGAELEEAARPLALEAKAHVIIPARGRCGGEGKTDAEQVSA
jgi:Fic family protein